MTRPSARIAISIVIALAAVALLFWWGGARGEDISDALVRCGPWPFVAVLGIQATIHLLRGVRLAGLLRAMGDEPPPVSVALRVKRSRSRERRRPTTPCSGSTPIRRRCRTRVASPMRPGST